MDPLRRHAQALQTLALRLHERLRPTDVIVRVREHDLILDLGQINPADVVVVLTLLILGRCLLVEDHPTHRWVLRHDLRQIILHGVDVSVPRRVDELDLPPRALPADDGLQHRHHRRETHASADQHRRRRRVHVQHEVAERHADVQLRAHGDRLVEDVRDPARGPGVAREFALHRDPEVVAARGVGETVLSRLVGIEFGDVAAHADELARLVGGEVGGLVGGGEVEGDDLVAFDDLLRDEELAPALPAARGLGALLVEGVFEVHEDVGELLVGGRPGGDDVLVRGGSEDFLDRREEVFPDDGIVLGCDAKTGVFVADAGNGGAEGFGVVDVGGVGPDGVGEGGGLFAGVLVGCVEDVLELRVGLQHALVENCCDGHTMFLEGWDGALDDLFLLGGEKAPLDQDGSSASQVGQDPTKDCLGRHGAVLWMSNCNAVKGWRLDIKMKTLSELRKG